MKKSKRYAYIVSVFLVINMLILGLGGNVFAEVSFTHHSSTDFDIKGPGGIKTTYNNGGYGTVLKVGTQQTNVKNGSGSIGGVSCTTTGTSISNGNYVKVNYHLVNNNSSAVTISLASHADIQINTNDSAPITALNGGRGFTMTDGTHMFMFIGKDSYGVTDIDTYWFGKYSDRQNNLWNQVASTGITGIDSGMAYAWQNRTIPANSSIDLSVLFGVGDLNEPPTLTATNTLKDKYFVNEDVQLIGQVNDIDSGDVVTIKYAVDGGTEYTVPGTYTPNGTPVDYSTIFTIPSDITEGNHTIQIWAADSKGNMSKPVSKTFYVELDKEAPTGEFTITPSGEWTSGNVKIDVVASDSYSGVKSIKLPDESIVSSETASYTATQNGDYIFVLTDNANNSRNYTITISNIDKDLPVGTSTVTQPTNENKYAVINFVATDIGSGVDRVVLPDNTSVTQSSIAYNVTTPGTYTFKVIDKVGNEKSIDIDVIIVSGGVEVKYIDQITKAEVGVKDVINGNVGTNYSTSAKTIEGYELVKTPDNFSGTLQIDKIIVTYEYKKNSNVVTKYIDENTQEEIIEDITLKYKEGDSYTTEEKEFDGYNLVDKTTNISGIVGRENITVIYKYKKISAGVDVKYVDEITGEEINLPRTHLNGLEKDPYTTEEKVIEGYELVTKPENATGEMTVKLITVTYGYKKTSNVIAKYIDLNSEDTIISDQVVKYKEGENYTTEEKSFTGYKFIDKTSNTSGTVQREDIVVEYRYKKISEGVDVKYIDKVTGEELVQPRIHLNGLEKDHYTTEPKDIDGYEIVSTPDNAEGEMTEGLTTVTYKYKKVSAGVDVKYIDEITGEEISLPRLHLDGLEKDPYSTTSKDIEGYELVTTPENATGEMAVELTTVTYGYKKNSNVISRYIDENSDEEIIPEVVVKYKEGYPYSTTERTFNGYRLVSKTDNTYGTVGREDIIVTYYYKKISAGVDVKYVDEMTGEEISGMIHMSGLEKQEYTTTSKEIPGYELVTVPENANGQMAVGLTTVTYGYKLISYVTVRCVDENTNRILYISEPVKYLEGETYTTFRRDINEYTFSRVDKAEEAQVGREDITVTYYYKKNTSITVKYVDILDNNKEIHEALPISGVQGDRYQISPVEVEGFRYVGSLGATQGIMGSEPTTIIYKYKKLANLVTEHIDANTGEKVAEDVTTTYKQGDTYEALPKNVKGYVVVQEPEEKTGIMGRDEIRKQYYYKRISKGLVVKYVDVKTNQVLDRIVYDGNENDKVTLETKSFMHYVLHSKPDMDEVILTPEANELIYYYRRTVEMDVVGIDVDTGEELYKTQISGREEDNYSTIAKPLDNYEVVSDTPIEGIFDRADTQIEFYYKKIGEKKDSTIILNYIDKDTNKVLKSEIITAKVGDKYTTQKLDFENYKFVELVGLESGIVTEEPQEVTYYYTKKTGKVVVVYEDEDGKVIKEDQIIGKVQEDYNVQIQEIAGYKIVQIPENTQGKFTEETIKLKVKLQKIEEPTKTGKVIVVYEDENGNELRREESIGNVGESFEFEIKDINGYEFVQKPENIKGNYVDGTIEIKIGLKKIPEPAKTGNVLVIYEDENGKEVKKEELIGNIGQDYKVDVKEIDGYKIVQIPTNIQGKFTEDSVEVKIKVEKIPEPVKTGKVIVVYEDEKGNIIKKEELIGNVGDNYSVDIHEQEGYKTIHVSDNTQGKYINGTIEVKVKVQKISNPPINKGIIIIKYLDDDGNVIKEELVKTGVPGEKITVDVPEIDGYKIIGDKTIEATFIDGKLVINAKYEKISNVEEEIKPQPDDNKEDNNNIPDTGDINVAVIFTIFALCTIVLSKKFL